MCSPEPMNVTVMKKCIVSTKNLKDEANISVIKIVNYMGMA